jgi:hypothetical protein
MHYIKINEGICYLMLERLMFKSIKASSIEVFIEFLFLCVIVSNLKTLITVFNLVAQF